MFTWKAHEPNEKNHYKTYVRKGFVLLACLLPCLLAACAQPTTGDVTQAATLTTDSSTPSAQAASQMPPTQTTCPAAGTARAAVMRSLTLGKQQKLVYIDNQAPAQTSAASGHLKIYDPATGQKMDLVSSGVAIQSAQLSADGQWVMFLSTSDASGASQHSTMLQLVRVDGKGLQTLYCFPATSATSNGLPTPPIRAQWSADQKYILFSNFASNTSTVTLLNVATGALQDELKMTDAQQLYYYTLTFWLDNTHAYIERRGLPAPAPPVVVYLLDITNNKALNFGNLQKVFEQPVRFSALSMDSNSDSTTLFVSYCLMAAGPYDTTIWTQSAAGGAQHIIYHNAPNTCARAMRLTSDNKLFLLVQTMDSNGQNSAYHLWKMNADGSNQTALTDLGKASGSTDYLFNQYSQYTWSNFSHDGSMYALQKNDGEAHTQTLLVGSLSGGTPKEFDQATSQSMSSLAIVGWTTLE